MITIERIEVVRVENAPLARPMHIAWDPGTVRTTDDFTLVRAFASSGHIGIGSGGRTRALRDAAAAWIEGQASGSGLGVAAGPFGLDQALRDVAAKAAGVRLAEQLGATIDRVPAYAATVELGTPQRRADDVRAFADTGWRGLKIRLHHETLAADLALAEAVRAAAPDGFALMADANQGRAAQRNTSIRWSFDRALVTAKALADLGFLWIEEPCAIDAYDDLARLRDQLAGRIAVAGGERDETVPAFERLVAAGAYDILQPDGVVMGDVSSLDSIAALARRAGIGFVMHHGGGGVAAFAHLHVAAAHGAPWFELIRDSPGEVPWPAQIAVTEPLDIDTDGMVRLPIAHGFGAVLDDDFVERYTVGRWEFVRSP